VTRSDSCDLASIRFMLEPSRTHGNRSESESLQLSQLSGTAKVGGRLASLGKPWGNLMSRRIRSAGGRDAVEIGRATISERQIVEKMRWFELHGNTPFSLVSICWDWYQKCLRDYLIVYQVLWGKSQIVRISNSRFRDRLHLSLVACGLVDQSN